MRRAPTRPTLPHRRGGTPMACHRRTIIAISAFAVVHLAACAGDTTKPTDAAATESTTITTDTATTPTRPHATVVPDPTVAVPDVRTQLREVVEEAVRASPSIPRSRCPRRGAAATPRRERRRRRRRPGDRDTIDARRRAAYRQQQQDVHRR